MTLPANSKRFVQSGLMLLALIPFFFACNDPNALGIELDNEDAKTQVASIEFVLPAKTIYIDSLRTEDLSSVVFGNYSNDSIFGAVKAIAYSEYEVGSGVYPDDSLVYVRAFVTMKFARASFSDETTAMNDISLYQASDTLFGSVRYLSNMHVDYDPADLLGATSLPLNLTDSVSEISLDDAFGLSLFNKLDSASRDSLTNKKYYYRPLVFEPSENNQNLLTFDLSADTVGIYVEMKNPTNDSLYYYKFKFAGDYYSEIIRDRSTGKYADLVNDYDASALTSGNTHLNTIAGLHPHLDLSPFLDFVNANDNIIINRAEIFLTNNFSHEDKSPTLQNIQFYIPNSEGRINGPGIYHDQLVSGGYSGIQNAGFWAVLNNSGYFLTSRLPGSTDILTPFYNESTFKYVNNDVSNFCQRMLDYEVGSNLHLTESLIISSPNRTTVGQSSFAMSEIKLKVYYTKLK